MFGLVFHTKARPLQMDHGRLSCPSREDFNGGVAAPEPPQPLLPQHIHYRSAALIYLYRQMRKHKQVFNPLYPSLQVWHEPENLEGQITQEVANTLLHVSNVPLNGLPECSLLFPLFLAGGEAMEDDDIDTIRTRLIRIHEIQILAISYVLWKSLKKSGDEGETDLAEMTGWIFWLRKGKSRSYIKHSSPVYPDLETAQSSSLPDVDFS